VAGKPERAKAVRNGLFNKIAGRFQEKSKSVKKAPAISQRICYSSTSMNMPAQRIRVATQQSISICLGVIFDLQCFVHGGLKHISYVLGAAHFHFVRCLCDQSEQSVRHS
jgi:hypothetical protein